MSHVSTYLNEQFSIEVNYRVGIGSLIIPALVSLSHPVMGSTAKKLVYNPDVVGRRGHQISSGKSSAA